jgi:mannosyltransferase
MDAAAARRVGTPVVVALAAVTTAAAFLRFYAIGRQGFWYDEATTAWLVRATPGQMLARLPHTESTPPLYYLLAWGWVRVFGDTQAGLRSLSALAGVITVPVAFAAARELVGRRVALLAAGLVAVNPLLIWYSQEARSYALLVLATTVALWLFARARADATPRRFAAWAVSSAVALCVHYFAVFLVVPEAVLLLRDRRLSTRRRLGSLAIIAIPGLALLVLAAVQSGRTYYFSHAPLGIRILQIPEVFIAGFMPPAGWIALGLAGLAAAIGGVLLFHRADPGERRGAIVALGIGVSAVLVPVLLAAAGADYLNARNVIGALVPLLIALACGLAARRPRALGVGAAGLLVGVSLTMVFKVPTDAGAQRTHWQKIVKVLGSDRRPHAILLLGAHTWSRIIGFYLPNTWWDPPQGMRVSEIDVLRKATASGPCAAVVWWGASCDSKPHPPLSRPPARGFRFAHTTRVAGFAVDSYVAPRAIRLYAHPPLEHFTSLDRGLNYKHRGRLMVTARRAPPVP